MTKEQVDGTLIQRYNTLRQKYNELKQENQKIKSEYNSWFLKISVLYTILWAPISYFAFLGIEESFKGNVKLQIIIWSILGIIVATSLFTTIKVYLQSYLPECKTGKKEKDINQHQTDIAEQTEIDNQTWSEWWQKQERYYKDPAVWQRYVICWVIHAASIAAYSAIFYFTVNGIKVAAKEFAYPDWKNTVVITVSISAFICLAVIDTIFYYSACKMVWWNFKPSTHEIGENQEVKGQPNTNLCEPQKIIEESAQNELCIKS